jgi:hypothetical protein
MPFQLINGICNYGVHCILQLICPACCLLSWPGMCWQRGIWEFTRTNLVAEDQVRQSQCRVAEAGSLQE